MSNLANWVEIPVKNLDRAKSFYEKLLDVELNQVEMHGTTMGFFPSDERSMSGALVQGEGYEPSDAGALVYLNGGKDLSKHLDRVERLGGKVLQTKTQITPESGYFGIFKDTEGNKIAFHSIT